jgi:hypothetical protein
MYASAKDKVTESFKFKEDENGETLRNDKGDFTFVSCGKHENPCYIQDGENKRPNWCKYKFGKNRKDKDMTPRPDCYQCPYLALGDVDISEYRVMVGAWDKASKEGKFKHLEDGDEPLKPPKTKKKSSSGRLDVTSPKGRGT